MNVQPRKLDPFISCLVPVCKNTVMKNPYKHFFYIPKSARVQWCSAVNKSNVPKSGSIYICEDHLNLEEDLMNYKDWIENKVTKPRLKPQVPETLKHIGKPSVMPSGSSGSNLEEPVPATQDKGILCMPHCSNKTVQVMPTMVTRSVSTRFVKKYTCKPVPTEEESSEGHNPSAVGSTTEFSGQESTNEFEVQESLVGRNFILNLIKNKPFAYIGVPKKYYWIIKYLSDELKVPSLHIITTLYKIKNNETFVKMKDLFQISLTTLWRTFTKILKKLRLFFMQMLYWPEAINIKKNLPNVFTTSKEYVNIQSIIDCFEVEIEKPKKPIEQALTWSQYKNCNTIKYLIGATPDGFINFVSEGCGGRISDIKLVEQSGFLETVPEHATILCDRGFKHLEGYLIQKSVKVLRPPSVLKDTKMTKSEVIESKILASLRIHIERVIRRVRLFKMLKPHAVVNNKLINILDDVVIVVCGLINLQSPIINNKGNE